MAEAAKTIQFPQRQDRQAPSERRKTPLEALEQAVRQDAEREPARYLKESEVPAGGE